MFFNLQNYKIFSEKNMIRSRFFLIFYFENRLVVTRLTPPGNSIADKPLTVINTVYVLSTRTAVLKIATFHRLVFFALKQAVLGTCATFSATVLPRHWRELKKVAHVAVAL